jgi:hypothetical protein
MRMIEIPIILFVLYNLIMIVGAYAVVENKRSR